MTVDSLGASVQNRAIWQLTITSDVPSSEPRKTVFIHARTHPGEVQGWWVTDELINLLLAEDEFGQNHISQIQLIDKCGFDQTLAKLQLASLGDHWGYGYDDLLSDLDYWAESPYVTVDSLGASVQNRAIWQLTITSDVPSSEPRKTVFIHARTHPGEVQGWWVTDELINLLLAEDEFGQFVRQRCVFYIIPMYNPDGVELEYPRENANGVDIESNWDKRSS